MANRPSKKKQGSQQKAALPFYISEEEMSFRFPNHHKTPWLQGRDILVVMPYKRWRDEMKIAQTLNKMEDGEK